MKELVIRFNCDKTKEELGGFLDNPFDVFVDGVKIDRLKSISLSFSKDARLDFDRFRYNVEQYFDWYDCENEN